jgi:hypothetical protein
MNYKELMKRGNALEKKLKPCPLCGAPAALVSTDWSTFTVVCLARECRCKVERGWGSPWRCVLDVCRAWNRRPLE